MISLIKDIGLWFVWFVLRPFLAYLPLNINYSLAGFASLLVYLISVRRKRIVYEEMERLFSNRLDKKEIRAIVKRSFKIFLKRQVENLLFGNLTKRQLDRFVSINGLDNLDTALKKGKGVILLLSHFGSFLMPLPVLGYKGYKVHQIGGKPLLEGASAINKKIFEQRRSETDKMPVQFIQTNHYLGPVVRALKNNEIVVIAFDGRTGNKWIQTKLLNRTADFSPGPFNLAIKTGATILPTFVVRGKDNKHIIIFESAMKLEVTDDREETLRINTKKYARILDRYIMDYPCHFAMTLYTVREEANKGLNRPLFID